MHSTIFPLFHKISHLMRTIRIYSSQDREPLSLRAIFLFVSCYLFIYLYVYLFFMRFMNFRCLIYNLYNFFVQFHLHLYLHLHSELPRECWNSSCAWTKYFWMILQSKFAVNPFQNTNNFCFGYFQPRCIHCHGKTQNRASQFALFPPPLNILFIIFHSTVQNYIFHHLLYILFQIIPSLIPSCPFIFLLLLVYRF